MNVNNLPAEVDVPMTLEERVAALEAWVARVTVTSVAHEIKRSPNPRASVFQAPSTGKIIENLTTISVKDLL